MAAYRKTYRKRKPAMRRRRKMMRKRRNRKYSRPDGYHSEKIIYNQTLQTRADGSCQFFFTWLKALQNAGTSGFSQSVAAAGNTDKQFGQCAAMYREYRVTGIAFKYTPTQFNGFQVALGAMRSGSKVYGPSDPVLPSPEDIEGAFDNKQYDGGRPFKRYYNVGKWAWSKGIKWQYCKDILTNPSPPDSIPHVDMSTGFAMTTTGFQQGDVVARLQIIYYVKFRTRTSTTYAQVL